MKQINHLVDPNYFNDAIEEFAFDYDWFVELKPEVDELGQYVYKYDKQIIHASLQIQQSQLEQRQEGNTTSTKYKLYCSSLYRISIGDFILYNNNFLHVDNVLPYDEFGVRQCDLTSINLNQYKNFKEYIEYLRGEKIV